MGQAGKGAVDRAGGGQVLQRYRRRAGLTQGALAERSGYSADYISKLERDERRLPPAVLDRLIPVLGLSPAEVEDLQAAQRQERTAFSGLFPLAGRSDEVAVLRNHLDGRGAPALLLSGEPGIGKTRLLDEAARLAADRGFAVLRGRCQRRSDPYDPLTDALAQSLDALSEGEREALEAALPGLGLFLPELVPLVAGSTLPPERERRLLFTAVAGYLRRTAGPKGTLLVLDDLHWAGPDALDLLTALLAAPVPAPVRLIGAYRDSEAGPDVPLGTFLADLARSGLVRAQTLGPLSSDASEELLRAVIGDQRHLLLLPAVARRAGGVPLFLISYAEALRGKEAVQLDELELPWTLVQIIRQRVATLPPEAHEVLSTAAIIGRMVPHRILVDTLSKDESDILTALESTCSARLLEEDEQGYRFAHDVIREVVEDDLSFGRRALLHRRVAEALERSDAVRTLPGRRSAGEIAGHLLAAGERSRALPYVLAAGDRAEEVSAHAEAERQYALAAQLAHGLGDPSLEGQSLEKLAGVLTMAARYDEALGILQQAVHLRHQEGDVGGEGCDVAEIGQVHFLRGSVGEGLRRVRGAQIALETNQSPDIPRLSVALARLYAAEASLLYGTGRTQEQLTASERALELARGTEDEPSQMTAEILLGDALVQVRRLDEALALYESLLPKYESAGDLASLCRVLVGMCHAQAARGSFQAAQGHLVRALEAAERIEDQPQIATILETLGWLAVTTGEWKSAHEYIDRLEALIRAWDMTQMAVILGALRGSLALFEGDQVSAGRSLEEALPLTAFTEAEGWRRDILHKLAMWDLSEGQPDRALGRLESVLGGDNPSEDTARGYLVEYAEAKLGVGCATQAQEIAVEVIRHARDEGDHLALVDMLRVYGMVLSVQECWDEARDAFEEAAAIASSMPYPYAEGRILFGLGSMFLAKGEPEPARRWLKEALATFLRLGATRDVCQAERLLAALQPV